tara:strand:- start:2002 stop:2871 length:870 start_codon:yes stop_codon:yes gene_type:complete
MMKLAIPAPAKINLGLEIVRRRSDGYHDVVTVLQALEFGDTIHLAETNAESIDGQPSVAGLTHQSDLAFRAAYELRKLIAPHRGVNIHVEKRIPVAAGLGGGSSNAAAVLLGLEALWGANRASVHQVARSLGTDVSFFLDPQTTLGLGRGDDLRPLSAAPRRWVVLARPERSLSTPAVYAKSLPDHWSGGRNTLALVDAIQDGRIEHSLLLNNLQAAAMSLVPEIEVILKSLLKTGARPALVSGSGPTCFGLYNEENTAQAAQHELAEHGWWTTKTRFRESAVSPEELR